MVIKKHVFYSILHDRNFMSVVILNKRKENNRKKYKKYLRKIILFYVFLIMHIFFTKNTIDILSEENIL